MSSQISASFTTNGDHVISASEDSYVYIWRYGINSRPSRRKGVIPVTQSYEYFHCKDVTVAVPWAGLNVGTTTSAQNNRLNDLDEIFQANFDLQSEANELEGMPTYRCSDGSQQDRILNTNSSNFGDRISSTWPEEKLLMASKINGDIGNAGMLLRSSSALGLVIVTAGRHGEIKIHQNFGLPVRI